MNREIKFKAKRIDTKVWVFGDLYHTDNYQKSFIKIDDNKSSGNVEVIPETVSQFTGLTDKNGEEIFENSDAYYHSHDGSVKGKIFYEQQACAFWFKWHDGAANRYKELKCTFSDGETYIAENIEVIE